MFGPNMRLRNTVGELVRGEILCCKSRCKGRLMEVLGVIESHMTMSRTIGDENNSTMIANVVRQKTVILEPHSIEKGMEQSITRYQHL